MGKQFFNLKKIEDIYGADAKKSNLIELEKNGELPKFKVRKKGAVSQKGFDLEDLGLIGRKVGFWKAFDRPLAISVFTTKGGVLKSTLALNLGRISALHGLKTCIIGLDIQGDITNALGLNQDLDKNDDLQVILEKLNKTKGLSDLFSGHSRLRDIVLSSDLPSLDFIPETPELVALNDSLNNINRREYWLKEKVIDFLKEKYDLIIMDCSPNWNRLTTNALVASDFLISPLECKINNFRNFKVFRQFLTEFKEDMQLEFESIFVPTKYSTNRKLGLEIFDWYLKNVPNCLSQGIRESVFGEEATALNISLIEHVPNQKVAKEFRSLLIKIHEILDTRSKVRKSKKMKANNLHQLSMMDSMQNEVRC